MSAPLSVVLAAAATTVIMGSAFAGSATPNRDSPVPTCTRVRLSLGAGGVGSTGGTIAYAVSLTNISRARCVVEGRPWVRVPPVRYPVTLEDLRSGQYGGRPARALMLRQGERARASVEMSRARCDFRKANAGSLQVEVGWAHASVTTGGQACLDNGAVVLIGAFRR